MAWTHIIMVLLLTFSLVSTSQYRNLRRRGLFAGTRYGHSSVSSAPGPKYSVEYYQQKLDHFNAADNRHWKQRYLVNQENWGGEGPILLYTGNEGDITWFCNNTGFIFDLSAELSALVIFIEHRYYGESLPFGPASFKDKQHLGYLTSEQALADFAILITEVKEYVFNTSRPVIAVGGSYGGMLAAWMRMKYPHIVTGALAASAPVWWFTGLTPCNSAALTITRDFERASGNSTYSCSETIRKSWSALNNMFYHQEHGPLWVSGQFYLCDPVFSDDAFNTFLDWLEDTWFNLAMVDYPYPASFLEPLPAWPINKTCQFLTKPFQDDFALLQAVAYAISVYHNSSGQKECYNISQDATPSLGSQGWDFQACTEMVMPQCSDGITDMLRPQPWNFTGYRDVCMARYGVTVEPYLIETLYGGKDISAHSNIIFSNGLLDPWHGGGVLHNISDTLIALTIPNGAHHLDLQGAREDDPVEVTELREKETAIIKNWLAQ